MEKLFELILGKRETRYENHRTVSLQLIAAETQGQQKSEVFLLYLLVVFSSSLVISCACNSEAFCAASACRFSERAHAAAVMAASSSLSKVSTLCSRTYMEWTR